MNDNFERDFYIDVARLGDKIDILIANKPHLAEETHDLRTKIGQALQLNADYYNETDADLKDELGFMYSEVVADIEEDASKLVKELKALN